MSELLGFQGKWHLVPPTTHSFFNKICFFVFVHRDLVRRGIAAALQLPGRAVCSENPRDRLLASE